MFLSTQVFYYTAYPAEGTRSYSLDGKHKFFTFLKKGLGFVVRKKELKRFTYFPQKIIFRKNLGQVQMDTLTY